MCADYNVDEWTGRTPVYDLQHEQEPSYVETVVCCHISEVLIGNVPETDLFRTLER